MKYFVIIGLAIVMVLGCDHVGSLDEDVGPNTDSDSDADTDSDTDTDTDTDTSTGTDTDTDTDTDTGPDTDECGAPAGLTGWGGPCHTNADCPANTECLILAGMDQEQGFCAAECCDFSTPDTVYCTDVSSGQESCSIGITQDEGMTWEPPFHCMIACNAQADCPTGTDCVDSGASTTICYGYAP